MTDPGRLAVVLDNSLSMSLADPSGKSRYAVATETIDIPEDHVRTEVEHLIRTLGAGGGYILGPSHAIQAGTPPESIVAMFDTAAR